MAALVALVVSPQLTRKFFCIVFIVLISEPIGADVGTVLGIACDVVNWYLQTDSAEKAIQTDALNNGDWISNRDAMMDR